MKRTIALICAFFVMFTTAAQASYTCADVYNVTETVFDWAKRNISPLGKTDSVASDYYVFAMSRADKSFSYNKYADITASRNTESSADARRLIMVNAASGGSLSDEFVAKNTYECDLNRAADRADAIVALLGGEYKIKSKSTDTDNLAAGLVSMQDIDGSFDGNVLSTAKSIIAMSFFSGKVYIVKGTEPGEKYRYDVNSAILRAVDYLQNSKDDDFGFGSLTDTAYAVMALDSAGVDADNDPGFSDGINSVLGTLIGYVGSEENLNMDVDGGAAILCALVSHLRAMQGNSAFFALRTEDMPYNPNDYSGDINRSGVGLVTASGEETEVVPNAEIYGYESEEKPYTLTADDTADTQTADYQKKSIRVLQIAVIVTALFLAAAAAVGFTAYVVYIRPRKSFHIKKSEDDEDIRVYK